MESLESRIRKKILARFPEHQFLKIGVVQGNCGAGVTIWICAPDFEGLSLVKQHQLLQKELKSFGDEIHKNTLKPMSPEQYRKKKEKGLLPEH